MIGAKMTRTMAEVLSYIHANYLPLYSTRRNGVRNHGLTDALTDLLSIVNPGNVFVTFVPVRPFA